MPVLGGFRRAYRRATEKCDEFAASQLPPKLGHHIVSTFTRTPEGSMSALGQQATCAPQKVMSALAPKANMCGATTDVCYGPIADTTADPESSKSGNGDLQHLREMTLRSV